MRAHSSEIHWRRVAHAIAFGILVPLTGVLGPALALAATSGCANTMANYYRAVGTAADTSKACYGVLRGVDSKKHEAYQQLRDGGDEPGAELLKSQWLDQFNKALVACQAIEAAASEALAAAPIVEHAIDKDKDVANWIARLFSLGAETVRILSELGIKLPVVGGK